MMKTAHEIITYLNNQITGMEQDYKRLLVSYSSPESVVDSSNHGQLTRVLNRIQGFRKDVDVLTNPDSYLDDYFQDVWEKHQS